MHAQHAVEHQTVTQCLHRSTGTHRQEVLLVCMSPPPACRSGGLQQEPQQMLVLLAIRGKQSQTAWCSMLCLWHGNQHTLCNSQRTSVPFHTSMHMTPRYSACVAAHVADCVTTTNKLLPKCRVQTNTSPSMSRMNHRHRQENHLINSSSLAQAQGCLM